MIFTYLETLVMALSEDSLSPILTQSLSSSIFSRTAAVWSLADIAGSPPFSLFLWSPLFWGWANFPNPPSAVAYQDCWETWPLKPDTFALMTCLPSIEVLGIAFATLPFWLLACESLLVTSSNALYYIVIIYLLVVCFKYYLKINKFKL